MKRILLTIMIGALFSGPAWANPTHELVQQMSDPDRNAYFTKVLQDAGERCDGATKTQFQRRGNSGDAVWNVACRNKKSYSIVIHSDTKGSTMITDCATLKALHVEQCFK
ncbi:exported protein of unknown function [Nitrospira japonica]|uniref:Secreted protein n=1 Tax=Nitrospira japonica TaxID=1325564 RepID=A0A1W1I963_9BACT|nr:hypothetical protein [Nitrospira japonica]SLM49530.1 exported protein of unknown function [Nitrospira japonica]